MSSRDRRTTDSGEDVRAPLLGHNGVDGGYRRERGDLPMWRHVLENKVTWALYTPVISSGAVALLLFDLPYRVHKLWALGAIVYIFSLVLFLVTLLTHVVRFVVRPSLISESIKHPIEGQYVSALPAALGILILNGATYAEKMHGYNTQAMRTFYWIYIVMSVIFAIGTPLVQFSKGPQNRRARDYSTVALTPTIPLLLAGPTAASVLAHLDPYKHHRAALGVIAFGVILQGMGFFLSLLYQSPLISRFHNEGFPPPKERPAIFLASIPPALTAWACTSLAQQAFRHFPSDATAPGGDPSFVVGGVALYYVGIALGLMFWGFSLWWFSVAMVGCLSGLNEMGIGNEVLDGFMVVFAHVAFFMASNDLLRVFEWPKALSVLNEVLGITTIVVWASLVVVSIAGLATGRSLRD